MTFRRILVPLDFGEPSMQALRIAIDLAKEQGATLTLLHTWEIPTYVYTSLELAATDFYHPVRDAAQQELDKVLLEVRKELPAATAILKSGSPWREVLGTVEEIGADLVVMGTHGRRGIARALLGSVTEKVVRSSPVPVLTMGREPPA